MRWLAVALLVLAGCAQASNHERDPAFVERVAMFATFARSLPACKGGNTQSAAELLRAGGPVGSRVTLRGRPTPVCSLEQAGQDESDEPDPEPEPYCQTTRALWVLWGEGGAPITPPRGPGKAACVSMLPASIRDAIVLLPNPTYLMDCDAAAAARGAPELTVAVTGTVTEVQTSESVNGVGSRIDVDVEGICRVDRS